MCRSRKRPEAPNRSQTRSGVVIEAKLTEVLDDCCHVTSASETFCSEGHIIT